MEPKRQREIALAAVAALVIAVAAFRVRTLSPAPPVNTQAAQVSSSTAAPSRSSPQKTLNEVNLAALKAPKAPPEVDRNPFRFKPKAPPPPPAMVSAAPPPQPAGPPPPPRIPLKFFGTIDVPGKGLNASLTDGRGVYRGFAGDIIEGRYRIVRIGVESIDLAYLDGRGRQTIRLTGQ